MRRRRETGIEVGGDMRGRILTGVVIDGRHYCFLIYTPVLIVS